MVEVFDTTEGRAFYKLCIRLDMDSFRNQAQASGAITIMQNGTLMALAGSGPDVHNGRLLQMVAEGNTLEKYRALAETVKALGHHGPYTQFMTFLEGETGEVVGMANEDSTINRLEKCCKNDNSARFSEVLERASKEFLHEVYENDKNDGGWRTVGAYLLCVAVQMEAIQCLRIILGNGVNADVKGKDDVTPLHKAARLNSPNVAKVLLEHGAQVNATTRSGWSPIHQATNGGNVETLLLLCSVEGAHLNLKTGSEGRTPLHIAVDYGSHGPECVSILLDGGARADIRDSRDKTAREWAVEHGHQDILDLLKAAARTPKEVLPQPTDPWKDERYVKTTYALQTMLIETCDVRGLCFSNHLIDRSTKVELSNILINSKHNEMLLDRLEASGKDVFFGKFREIIRHFSQQRLGVFDDILQVWDLIHPPPEDYLALKEELANGR